MDLKRRIAIFITLIMILQAVVPSSLIKSVKAANSDISNKIDFLTGVKITDKEGNDINGSIDENEVIKINYTWAIKDDDNVENGDYYIMQLPKGVKISEDITKDIFDQEGNKIADLYVYKNGELKFVFTDYVDNNKSIKGELFVECSFNKDEIEDGKIEFEVGGSSETVIIDFKKPAKKIALEKYGIYNGDGTITWTININKGKEKILKGSKLIDVIKKENLGFHNYIKGSESIDNNAKGRFEYNNEDSFTYTFDEESELEYKITFKTEVGLSIHNGGIILVENTAKFQNDKELSEDNEIITITLGDIQKSGVYDWHENKIDWTIVVNKESKNLKNVSVKDILPEGLVLNENSLNVEPNLQGSHTYNEATRELNYSLGDINKEYIIKFSTYINLSGNEENTEKYVFKNIAELEVDGSKSGESDAEIEVPIYVIRKNFTGYNPSTGEISWSISINETSSQLKNALLTDDILNGQKYVEGSFTLNSKRTGEDKFDSSKFTYDNTKNSERTGNISYKFGDINEPYYITFKTKIVDYSDPVDIFKAFTNKAILYFGDRYHTGHDEYRISNKTLLKEGIAYDYINKIVTWRIKLNQNRFPITNATITDSIPKGQEYVKDSFKISPKVNGNLKHELASGEGLEKLTYIFNEKISDVYEIEFKTKITDLTVFEEDGSKKVYNEAFLTGDEIDITMASRAEINVDNPLVKKSFNYEEGNDFIDWYVEGNTEDKPIKGATIEDNLQDGLILKTDTIKLNKLKLDNNGNYTLGEEVTITDDNINYDTKTNKFVFKFSNDFEGPFKLSFRTKVTKEGSYQNTILFKGSESESSTTEETEVGGWGEIEKGSIKIVKVDNDDTSRTLKGAKFELLDKDNNVIETSKSTDEDGVVVFDELNYDVEYIIKEVIAPEGYEKSNEVYKFTLKNNDKERNKEYKFKNIKTPIIVPQKDGSILINKINESKQKLEGVEFTLYDDNGNILETKETNSLGLVEFKGLSYGKYLVKETKALPGYKSIDKEFTANISKEDKNIFIGTITNEKLPTGDGIIKLLKTDELGCVLKGVEFTLYDSNKNIVRVGTSNAGGIVEFKNLAYGKYTLKETKALAGYKLLDKEFNAEVSKAKKLHYLGIIKNEKLPVDDGVVKLLKTDELGCVLKGVEFTLYDSNKNIVRVGTSNAGGIVEFKNLKYGKYTLKETKALAGYKLLDKEFNAEVSKAKKLHYLGIIKNEKLPVDDGVVKLLKTDELGCVLKGVEFTLYDSNKNVVRVGTSNSGGIVEFKNLKYGKYILKETKALAGYKLLDKEFNAEVSKAKKLHYLGIIKNEKLPVDDGIIKLLKTDELGCVLKGVEFTLYDSNKNVVRVGTSNSGGIVEFKNLKYGKYILKETKALAGYKLLDKEFNAEVSKAKKLHYLGIIKNEKLPVDDGVVKLLKTDESGCVLKGAEFTLYDSNKNIVRVGTSNACGIVEFKNLKYGKYTLKETKAPEGFKLLDKELIAEVSKKKKVHSLGTIKNEKLGSILFKKIDGLGCVLKNVEFTLYDNKNNVLQVKSSNNLGIVEFKNLDYGKYRIRETKALPGYQGLDKDLITEVSKSKKNVYLGLVKNIKSKSK